MSLVVVVLIALSGRVAQFAYWICERMDQIDEGLGAKCWEAADSEAAKIEKRWDERSHPYSGVAE